MTSKTTTLSIIIPLYNEALVLARFWQILKQQLDNLKISYEVLFIDDGSQDNTWTAIEQLAEQCTSVHGLCFTRNFGKEAAILAGLEHAQGQAVVVMDGDGQHPPELLIKMVDAWQNGQKMVAACKTKRQSDSIFKRICAHLFAKLMYQLSGLDLMNSSDYRLLDRSVVNILLSCPEKIRFFRGMASWTGIASHTIYFSVPARLAGDSHWSRFGLMKMALHAIIAYSAKPLYLLFTTGLIGLIISALLAVQALYSWLTGIAVSGWTSLTLVILIFGSANLVGLGLLGLYLGQLFDEIKARPAYLVRKITNKKVQHQSY